ncbi:MAG: LamG domain-containing protein [Pseudomonadota bacterium]
MKVTISIAVLALTIAGCNTGGSAIGVDDLAGGSETTADAAVDTSPPDSTSPDSVPDAPPFEDGEPGDIGPACDPGEGCFLDPCWGNEDCQSGWCVEHMGEGVCTRSCQTECPQGWTCQQVAGTDPDLVYVCVSSHANLCKPCAAGGDCLSPAGSDDACVAYGDEGAFCGGACGDAGACPWGFTCKEVETVDGVALSQCVADAGVCPCTDKSVALGLWTPCAVESDDGACDGKRVCTEAGLSACDAATPVAEICNGVDDDCDGNVDEPLEVGGDFVNLCDDGSDCTMDTCDGEAGCTHDVLQGTECIDGNPCTVADHCEAGVCVGAPVTCDDDDPCTADSCAGDGGCVFAPAPGLCDDGDPCTVGDFCDAGDCLGVAVDCQCTTDAQCQVLEDGDLCTGTLFCDTAAFPYVCKVDPDSVVDCPEPEGPDGICLKAVCDPGSAECGLAPDHEGFACDDGDSCTIGDTCQEGVCAPGPGLQCLDGNPCTDDACSPLSGCTFSFNSAACSDGNPCTTADECAAGACVGGAFLDCDDGNPCTIDGCAPAAGCTHTPTPGPCSDGDPCTEGDACQGGACVPGPLQGCDDGNPCTNDSCDPAVGCVHALNALPCDDGDVCTLGDTCQSGACAGTGIMSCADGNPCTDDSCAPLSGCVFAFNAGACDDGNPCTTGDHCAAGACLSTGIEECEDDNPCTKDLCLPAAGCAHQAIQGPCDDGDPCTINDFCAGAACVSGPQVSCGDGNDCTADACVDGICEHAPVVGPCDDGNSCTEGDHCDGGACVAGGVKDCDDGEVCTSEYCDPILGCTVILNSEPCDDGDPCTAGDLCSQGACLPGGAADCSDGNLCTDDSCTPGVGCKWSLNTAPCDDQDTCTEDDVCVTGICVGGLPLVCEDGNPCTDNTCDPLAGCDFVANADPCEDGDACTIGDSCENGACTPSGVLVCDDGNVCTEDSCDGDTGCVFTPAPNGTPCGDPGEQCLGGVCVLGDPALVLYFDFESGVGQVPDLGISGSATPGVMMGTVNYHNAGKYGSWSLRSPGGSGANDYLDLTGDLSDLNMTVGYSFMAWIKILSSGQQGIIVLGSCCSPREGYTLNLTSSSEIRYWAGQSNNDDNHNAYGTAAMGDGQWHHVGARVNNDQVQILIDGVVKETSSEAALPSTVTNVNSSNDHAPNAPHVGGYGISGATGADVLIDEVRVYKKHLTDAEWGAAMGGM